VLILGHRDEDSKLLNKKHLIRAHEFYEYHGSKTVILSDVFVPKYRTHSIVDNYNGTDPGLAINDRPYYRLPWRLVFGYCIAAPAAGATGGAAPAPPRLAPRTRPPQ
jgi:hypothetical protein